MYIISCYFFFLFNLLFPKFTNAMKLYFPNRFSRMFTKNRFIIIIHPKFSLCKWKLHCNISGFPKKKRICWVTSFDLPATDRGRWIKIQCFERWNFEYFQPELSLFFSHLVFNIFSSLVYAWGGLVISTLIGKPTKSSSSHGWFKHFLALEIARYSFHHMVVFLFCSYSFFVKRPQFYMFFTKWYKFLDSWFMTFAKNIM